MNYISDKSLKIALKIIEKGSYTAVTRIPSITLKLVSTETIKKFEIELLIGLN